MSSQVSRWASPVMFVLGLVSAMVVPTSGQPAGQAGAAPMPMRPYGQLAGCSEDPARFHPCALEKARAYKPPMTPDGHPDFSGYWNRARVTSDNIEAHAEVVGDPGGTSLVIDPPDGKIPYQPWAAAQKRDNLEHYIAPQAMCFPPGSPRSAYAPGGYQILQSPGYLIFMYDFAHVYRVVHTDDRPHVPGNVHLMMGDSRGRWDGNTLVVDVTNFSNKMWVDNEGNFLTSTVHIVERWTLIAPDAIAYEARIEDPKVFTRPWTVAFGIRRNAEPGYEIWETACHEGNRGRLPGASGGLKPYLGVTPPN